MDKEICQKSKEEIERLKEKRNKHLKNGNLDKAVFSFKKLIELESELRELCGEECNC